MSRPDIPEYYNNPRADVQSLLPGRIERALDVGCGAGAFGGTLRERGAHVTGLEMVEEMAAIARDRLNEVHVGDAFELIETLPAGHFDLVTFNDVLEHLPWPDRMLERTKRVLAPGGCVVASLPNIRHWDAFLKLAFEKDFPWEPSGIYDRTHLRFFTEKSARRLFEENGWRVERMEGFHPTPSRKLRVVNLLTGNRWADCRYLQFGIVARL